ncbi:MAG: CbrC family protein [Kiritimatiellaeota bacterium]|nr:CbrC family protein [Kiritimatiellota bacterium]
MENFIFSNFIWIIPLFVIIVGFFGIVITGAINVSMVRNAKNPLKPIILNPKSDVMKTIQSHYAWTEANGFEWLNSYQSIGTAVVAAWKKKDEPTFLCVYCLSNGKISREFNTEFQDGGGLDTSDSPDAGLFPRREGDYSQSFPNTTIEEQWNWHSHAIEYLTKNLRLKFASDKRGFEEVFAEGLKAPVDYATSLPLWPLRIPYWFLVRRKRMLGKTVSELLHAGLLK